MKLVVGLGNPGRGYANNRHNVGFMCLNHFARMHDIRFDKKQGKARIGTGDIGGSRVMLAKPQTYMNLSGQSATRLVKKFGVSFDNLVVIQDDLDLPLGKIRIRQGGSSAGHKGIESIISCLGSKDFIRIRVGIGRPITGSNETNEYDVINYVLGDFSPDEGKIVSRVIPGVSEVVLSLLNEGLTAAMNKHN
ncbi:aminoacyl-tRNA hydrolase [Chloroflexota bacterium]